MVSYTFLYWLPKYISAMNMVHTTSAQYCTGPYCTVYLWSVLYTIGLDWTVHYWIVLYCTLYIIGLWTMYPTGPYCTVCVYY